MGVYVSTAMRFLLIILLVIICINFMDTRKKPKKSKPKPKPKGKPVRPTVLNQPNPAIFKKYTRRGGGGRCWWDMTRTDCAVCSQYFANQIFNPCRRAGNRRGNTNNRFFTGNPTIDNGALGFVAGFAGSALLNNALGNPCGK